MAVDTDGIAARVVALPVPEGRYSSLHAVKGGLAWLLHPVAGKLGEGVARLTDARPRPCLQRFDLKRHSVTALEHDVDWFVASGDGSRLVLSDHDCLAVIPGDRKGDPDSPEDRISVDGTRARFLADPAALWRHALDEAGRIVAHDFWVAGPGRRGPRRGAGQLPAAAGPGRHAGEFADVLAEAIGELGTSHAYVTRRPATAAAPAAIPPGCSAPTWNGARRKLADPPDRAGGVLRPTGALAAGRAGRARAGGRPPDGHRRAPGGRGRPRPAAGRGGGQAGRADRG